jgi:hypothetical protein
MEDDPGILAGIWDGLLEIASPRTAYFKQLKAAKDYENSVHAKALAEKRGLLGAMQEKADTPEKKMRLNALGDYLGLANELDFDKIGDVTATTFNDMSKSIIPTDTGKDVNYAFNPEIPEPQREMMRQLKLNDRDYDKRMLDIKQQNANTQQSAMGIRAKQAIAGGAGGARGAGTAKVNADVAKVEGGKQQLSTLLDEVRGNIAGLSKLGALSSPSKSTKDNLYAGVRNSPAGQFVGRAVGTEEQTFRDNISNLKPRIVSAVMAATGMSSKQLDNVVEFKAMMDSLGSAGQSEESQLEVLKNLEKTYLSGDYKVAEDGSLRNINTGDIADLPKSTSSNQVDVNVNQEFPSIRNGYRYTPDSMARIRISDGKLEGATQAGGWEDAVFDKDADGAIIIRGTGTENEKTEPKKKVKKTAKDAQGRVWNLYEDDTEGLADGQ